LKKLVSFIWQWLLSKVFSIPLVTDFDVNTAGSCVHIFGSGPSAENTRDMVQSGDFCFACNHAIKWRPFWDCIFIETVDHSTYGLEQTRLLSQVSYGLLICKNNYPHHPFKSIFKLRILRNFPHLLLLPEYQADAQNIVPESRSACIDEMFCIYPQYASSILTMILFAVRSGTKQIWIHGVDSLSAGSDMEFSNRHATERFIVPFSGVFEQVRLELQKLGIQVKVAGEVK
jgi:hypothetical protein